MARDKHLERIVRESGVDDLLEVLTERLPASDLSSLLMEVARRRAERETPTTLLSRFERDPFARPSPNSPVAQLEFDRTAFLLAQEGGFEPVEISPLGPLGTVSALTNVSQKKILATTRPSEVVADPTNVLALMAAGRRRSAQTQRVNLCASHRVVRVQPVSGPISFAHFRLFALVTAGRDTGSFGFESSSVLDHIRFHLRLLNRLQVPISRIALAHWNANREKALHGLVQTLESEFPDTRFELDPDREHGRTYYREIGFQIFILDAKGAEVFLVDGGAVDWTQQLLNNRKEGLMTSALGTERLLACLGDQAFI